MSSAGAWSCRTRSQIHSIFPFTPSPPPPFLFPLSFFPLSSLRLLSQELAPSAVIIGLIGYLESIAISKSFARENSYSVHASQEFIALGAANFVGSFFHAYPVTGSFSRTSVNAQCNVESSFSGVVTGLVVILVLEALTKVFFYIPKAVLGMIIILAVMKMVNVRVPLQLWRVSKLDLLAYIASFCGCLFLDIQYGVPMGVGISLLGLLYNVARPKHAVISSLPLAPPVSESLNSNESDVFAIPPGVVVFQLGGDMIFPSVEDTIDLINDRIRANPSVHRLVLDMSKVSNMDFTGVQALLELAEYCESKTSLRLCVAHLHADVREVGG